MILVAVTIMVLPCFAEDIIYGCYPKNNGQLRIVDNPNLCKPSEKRLVAETRSPSCLGE